MLLHLCNASQKRHVVHVCVSVCLYRRFFAGLCWWNSETILTAIWSVWKWFQFWHGWELGHRSKRHAPLVFSCKRDTHCEIYCGKMTWTNVCYLSNIVKCLEKVKVIWQLFLIIVIIYKIQIWFIKNFSHIGPNLFKSVSKIQAKGKVTLGIEREGERASYLIKEQRMTHWMWYSALIEQITNPVDCY